jgi:radical SAM-linked protein
MNETYAQRMRVVFSTDDTVKYVGHLDMHRAWERAIRRARLPLAYSQGFNPQPRLHFAAAIPVGFTGRAEIADVYLNEELDPAEFTDRLAGALPPGIRPERAEPVAREVPSLQSQVTGASYRVEVETDEDDDEFAARLAEFLARPEAWRERRKGKDVARYDLRPLVHELTYMGRTGYGQSFTVGMRAEPGATGRPDELLAELGYETAPRRIERRSLMFLT